MNRIENVRLAGGLLGLIGSSPLRTLNKAIKKHNDSGWQVIQVLPSDSGNIAILALRIAILILTLGLFTIANGYYLVLELKDGHTVPVGDDHSSNESSGMFGTANQQKSQNDHSYIQETNDNSINTNSIF